MTEVELIKIEGSENRYNLEVIDDEDINQFKKFLNSKIAKRCALVICIISLVLGCFSMISNDISLVPFEGKMQRNLDEKNAKVMTTSVGGLAVAQGISLIPTIEGDDPVVEQIKDVSQKLLYVNISIVIQKIVLSLSGILLFMLFIPLASIMFFLNRRDLSKKFIITGLIFYLLIPISFGVASITDRSLSYTITTNTEQKKDTNSSEEKVGDSFLDKAQNFLSGIMKGIDDTTSKVVKDAEDEIYRLFNALLIFVANNIIIPVLTLIAGLYSIKFVWRNNTTINDSLMSVISSTKNNYNNRSIKKEVIIEKTISE